MLAILGAMDAEVSEFLAHAQPLERIEWHGFIFHRVRFADREAVLAKSGVGKVFCALVAQKLIDTFAPSALVFTGRGRRPQSRLRHRGRGRVPRLHPA